MSKLLIESSSFVEKFDSKITVRRFLVGLATALTKFSENGRSPRHVTDRKLLEMQKILHQMNRSVNLNNSGKAVSKLIRVLYPWGSSIYDYWSLAGNLHNHCTGLGGLYLNIFLVVVLL